MGKYLEYVNNKKKKEETENSSSSARFGSGNYGKYRAEKVIGLDTFASDLDKMNKTVSDIYSGWQTAETMGNTLASVKSMQDRVNAYQDYHKQFGEGMDISDVVDYYKNAVDNWQKQTDAYGYYKDKASFDSAMKQSELKKKYAGLTFDQVQSELEKQIKGSDDYNYLSNYTDYADLREYDKALAHLKSTASNVGNIQTDVDWKTLVPQTASTPVKEVANVEVDWNVIAKQGADYATKGSGTRVTVDAKKAQEDWNTLLQPSMDEASKRKYQEELERARNVYALDHTFDYYKDYMDREDFAEKSQYVSNGDDMYEWINNPYSRSSILADKTATTSDGLPVFTLPIAQVSMHTSQLNDDEKAVYNYIYATEGAESANTFLKAMETTLGKRYADTQSAEMEEYVDESEWNGALASVASVPLKLAGAFGTGAELVQSQITGEDYDVYSINNAMANIASDTRKHVGDNIEEGTELKIGGQNAMRFLYDTGMSMSDSLATMGAVGKATSIVMGTGAFQQTAREMVEAGEDAETTMKMALASGVTEAVFEHIGIDNLFKIKNSDTLANAFKNIMKQAGIEGLEEIGTEFANFAWDDAIRGDNSEIAKMKQELEARGFSESEINTEISKYVVKNLAMAGVGGALSGGVMGGGASLANYASIKSEQRQQKELEQEILTTMQMTPEELEALEVYEKMAGKTSAKGAEITNTSDNQVESNKTELQSIAEGMDKAKGELLLAQYDGKTDVESYVNSFNLAYFYGEKGYTQQKMLQMKGVLTPRQVSEIYKATVFEGAKRRENAIKAISEKHGNGITVAGKFDDSIINYEKTDVEGKVRWDSLTGTQKSAVRFAQAFSKATGVNITFTDKGMAEGFNGKYESDTNTITLDIYAGVDKIEGKNYSDAIIPALSHEMTHWMKEKSPVMYQKMREYVLDTLQATTGINMVRIVDSEMARIQEAHPDIKVTEDYAMDEILARACEDMLSNSTKARELLNTLSKEEQKSFIDHVKEFFQNLKEWVDDLLGQYQSGSAEAKFLRESKGKVEKLSKMWDKALEQAIQSNQSLQKEGKIGEQVINEAMAEVGLLYDAESESVAPTQYSEGTWTQSEYVLNREVAIKNIMEALGVSRKRATQYIDSVNSVAKMIAEDRERLDYEANLDENATVVKPNSEYKWSVDMSTLCAKRLYFPGTFDAVQRLLPNTAMDSDDIVRLRAMMMEAGYEVACGICYVESTRREIGTITADFIERYKVAQTTGKPIARINSEGKEVYLTKDKNKIYAEKDYTPTLADLNTTDIDLVKREHPAVYDAYLAYMNARGQAKPKLLETRAEYKGEILNHFKSKNAVKSRNSAGGLRLQSFSDFEVPHLIDMMQVVMDMARVGLKSQAYTKVVNFAEVFGDTGVKINLSLIAKGDGIDENGNLIFDDVEGINHEEAFRLRDKYSKNVGTILVGKNDAHIIKAMADSRIDYIIPFHKSSWKESLYDALGLTGYDDYTETQNEKPIDKDRKIKNFDPSEYWDFSKSGDENAQIYLAKCKEDGRTPKFPQFAQCEGYWKLLIDFKMYDNNGVGSPQTTVVPNFNMEEATRILNEYKGGHRSFPVANDVVDKFVDEYKKGHPQEQYSDREVTPLTAEDYKAMKSHFGTTGNYNVAGYLLQDGYMLDFSGKHWGDTTSRTRQVDHRDVSEVIPDSNNGFDSMVRMISNGNIRLMPESGGINLAVAPTKNQRTILRRYIDYMNQYQKEGFALDIDEVGGDTIQSFTYEAGTSADRILGDIDRYFKGGRQSDLMRFHTQYSDRNASYKTDRYYSKFTPNSREEAKHTNMLDNRNIARYRKEIDGVFDGTLPTGRDVMIGMPSELLMKYGVSNRPIHMTQRIARKIAYPSGYKIGENFLNEKVTQKTQGDMEGKHNLGISVVKNLPLQISQPIAITKNNKKNRDRNSVVLWTNWISEDGKGIMLGLVIDSTGATGLQNNISTVFQAETEYAEQFFENEEDILYTKKNKDIKQLLSDRRYMPKAMVDDTFIKNLTEKYPNVKYSDRTTTSIYDTVGELESLRKQNAKLSADVERLNERLRLEKQVTKGNSFNENQLDAVVRHLKSLAKSDYDSRRLREEIKNIYTYIV